MGELVSIVIPAYNASNYLAEAIDSALAQTYDNIEIIVVNDGSTDQGATRTVAQSYGGRIRYFEKENGGCASALNYGVSVMRGDYFSWLSHDDLYLPEKIETMLRIKAARKLPNDTVLVCDTILVDANGDTVACPFKQTKGDLKPWEAFDETLNRKTFNGCGMLIPKSVMDECGFFETEYKHLLDREYWMRIAMNGHPFFVIDESLVKGRVHKNQITVKRSELLFGEEERLIQDYYDRILRENGIAFSIGLCKFAYKRKHYARGKQLKRYLKEHDGWTVGVAAAVLKYTLYGRVRVVFGNLYKKVIRRSK